MNELEQELAQSGIEEVKPEANILDATSGNRAMWKTKDSSQIIYIDIEPELEYKPDMILDCTKTGFQEKRFNLIFYDPPHYWGVKKNDRIFTMPSRARAIEKFNYRRKYPTYYGLDKFKSKSELLGFIHRSQQEFSRILKDEGVLFFKWSEVCIPLNKILPFMRNWIEMMRIHINYYGRVGDSPSYWIVFMKKGDMARVPDLTEFTNKEAENGV